jgi:subtilisin family serine protease
MDLLSGHGVAKNVLTIAAVEDLTGGYTSAPAVLMSTFSSFGGCDDGRIKPDISANGVGLNSTLETATNAYGSLSGTSMAAPSVAGSLALLREHFSIRRMRAASAQAPITDLAGDSRTPRVLPHS